MNEFDHHFLGANEDLVNAVLFHAGDCDARFVIFDLYPKLIPSNIVYLLRTLRQDGRKTIGVDSLAYHRRDLDLVFIPSFRNPCPQSSDINTPVVFGWDCFLLNVNRYSSQWRQGREVLILTGGSDAAGLGETLPTLLDKTLPGTTELHWVIGPFAKQPIRVSAPKIPVIYHQSPPELNDLMLGVSYALTVYGVSFFELLYFGIPTVVFSPYGQKDHAELAEIAEEGVALVAEDEVEAAAKLAKLMKDEELSCSLSKRAREKLSVSGGHKFASAVAEMME